MSSTKNGHINTIYCQKSKIIRMSSDADQAYQAQLEPFRSRWSNSSPIRTVLITTWGPNQSPALVSWHPLPEKGETPFQNAKRSKTLRFYGWKHSRPIDNGGEYPTQALHATGKCCGKSTKVLPKDVSEVENQFTYRHCKICVEDHDKQALLRADNIPVHGENIAWLESKIGDSVGISRARI